MAHRAIIMMNTVKLLAKYGTPRYYYDEYGKVVKYGTARYYYDEYGKVVC